MVTMRDIAEKAGVSSATVSRILNNKSTPIAISEKTRQKVMSIAKDIGYRPNVFAQSLRTKKSYLVGLVLWDLTDPFFSEVLRGTEQVIDESGYSLLLTTAEAQKQRERLCLEKMSTFRPDGIMIVGGPKGLSDNNLSKIAIDQRPVVLVDTRAEGLQVSSVTVDNIRGGYIGAEYLINKDNRSITYISGKKKTYDIEDRLQGVRNAIAEYRVEDRFFIVEGGPGEHEGYEITEEILSRTRPPVAIFAVNDVTALGSLRACTDRGWNIPAEAAVLGFDDLSMAQYLAPRLSTVHQPRLEMGREGARRLLKILENLERGLPAEHSHQILEPQLVLRESA
jgi:LacI family transcriptional regulator